MEHHTPQQASAATTFPRANDLVFHLSLGSSATGTGQQRLTTVREQVQALCERYALQPVIVDIQDYGTEVRGQLSTELMQVELRAW